MNYGLHERMPDYPTIERRVLEVVLRRLAEGPAVHKTFIGPDDWSTFYIHDDPTYPMPTSQCPVSPVVVTPSHTAYSTIRLFCHIADPISLQVQFRIFTERCTVTDRVTMCRSYE